MSDFDRTGSDPQEHPSSLSDAIDRLLDLMDAAPGDERMPRVRGGERDEIDPRVRRGVWLRDGGRCSWCGNAERGQMELDHIVPWSAGGTDRSANLRVLCTRCNERRSNYQSDALIARVIPVSYACSRCAGRLVDERYETKVWDSTEDHVEDWRSQPVEFSDPVAAFCVTCRFAGTAERSWTL